MSDVIKVFTPVKRVPTMIGKAPNGQKLPFGPYTLPQVAGGAAVLLTASVFAVTFPVNPAVIFMVGIAVAALVVFSIGLVPYTGVRLTSRAFWLARLIVVRSPVSASGMPITTESPRYALYVEETVAVLLPEFVVAEVTGELGGARS